MSPPEFRRGRASSADAGPRRRRTWPGTACRVVTGRCRCAAPTTVTLAMVRLRGKTVRAVGRGLGAGRSGQGSPRAARRCRPWRATRVSSRSALIDPQPTAARRVGGSRQMGATAAGVWAPWQRSAAAGGPC
jgi:hypothetical protein